MFRNRVVMTSGYSNLPHRNTKTTLACDLSGLFVTGINVAHDSGPRIVDQHARYLFGGEIGAVDNEHLPLCIERPMPTPPRWCNDTQVAPLAVFNNAFNNGQSAIASLPSSIASVSR